MAQKRPLRQIPGQEAALVAAKAHEAAENILRDAQLKISDTQLQNGQFKEEEPEIWQGYIEWEKYPEKREIANKLMKEAEFSEPPGKDKERERNLFSESLEYLCAIPSKNFKSSRCQIGILSCMEMFSKTITMQSVWITFQSIAGVESCKKRLPT